MSVYTAALRYRRQLTAVDQDARADLIKAYAAAWRELRVSLDEVTALIESARSSGESVSSAWLARQTRYQALLGQVAQEVQRIANLGAITLPRDQQTLVRLAQVHVRELTRLQQSIPTPGIAAGFNQLNPEAVETIAGFLSDGSPLRTLLDELGPEAAHDVAAALKRAVILGEGPAATARRVRRAFGGNLYRASLISRDALIRAYQESSHQTMLANRDVLNGWYWLSAKDARTCPSCLAMHGTFHRLTERLRDHPNGRCTAVPGVKGEPLEIESGEAWFRQQSRDTQERIVGIAAQRAYAAGAVTLADFAGFHRSRRWGTHRQARSLTEIVGAEEALQWRRAA